MFDRLLLAALNILYHLQTEQVSGEIYDKLHEAIMPLEAIQAKRLVNR